jgi:peptidoglycan hydrolase CwlO-like protein
MGKSFGFTKENTKSNKMNETIKTILLVIIIALVGYSIFITDSIKTDVQSHYDKIDSLQLSIDSATAVNSMIDEKLIKLDADINNVTNEILAVDQRINDIKIQTNGKVINVDKYTHAELKKFFSKRYNTAGN